MVANPKNSVDYTDETIPLSFNFTEEDFEVDCHQLRFPTNPNYSFYKRLIDDA